jgi:DNA-binding transcriptional ArsR family regulator
VFAALGDETRLSLLAKLSDGAPRSISQLAEGTDVTRQAITKHLRVLESVGIVSCAREGRESRFTLQTEPLEAARHYLGLVSEQWDDALARLKSFLEE